MSSPSLSTIPSTSNPPIHPEILAQILHPDVLSQIFHYLYTFFPHPSTTTLFLSVSTHWMALARSLPRLWTTLILNKPADFLLHTHRTRALLDRSKEQALDVRISLPDTQETARLLQSDAISDTISMLRPHVHRFRSLSLHAPAQEDIEVLMAIGQNLSAPLLENLDISVARASDMESMDEGDRFLTLMTAFTGAERLSRLSLPAWPTPPPEAPPFGGGGKGKGVRLLRLDGRWWDSVDTVGLVDIFGSGETGTGSSSTGKQRGVADTIEEFVYTDNDDFSWAPTSHLEYPKRVLLPKLRKVDVTAPGAGTDLLRAFIAPNLEELRLDGFREHDFPGRWEDSLTEPISVTLQRVAERSPRLKKLELRSVRLHEPEREYIELLKGSMFKELEELCLDGLEVGDEHFYRAISQITGWDLPLRLRKLRVVGCGCESREALALFARAKGKRISVDLDGVRI